MNPQPAYPSATGPYPQLDRPWRKLLTAAALMGAIAILNAWDPALPTALAVTVGCLLILAAALLTRLVSADLRWLKSLVVLR